MPTSANIVFKNHSIQYHKLGQGRKIMLAFHGFGQEGTALFPVAGALAEEYTMYSFDLFYHGKSYWNGQEQPITKKFWRDFIQEFIRANHINRFTICGFSIGGKFALATLEAFPDLIDKVILIAPDGIKANRWYRLATSPLIFKHCFRSLITRPQWFFKLVNMLKKTGFVDKGILTFATSQMATAKKRRRVYYTWITSKPLSFNMKKMAGYIAHFDIEVQIFLGKHDKIITKRGVSSLLKHLKTYELLMLESGHNRLIEKTGAFLREEYDQR